MATASESQSREGHLPANDEVAFLHALMRFANRLHAELDPRRVASTAANDSLALTGADRISVARTRGKRTRIQAISGQQKVERKSDLIRRLEDLLSIAADLNRPVVFDGDLESLDPLVRQPVADYVSESHVRLLALLPLRRQSRQEFRRTRKQAVDQQLPENRDDQEVFGMLVVESYTRRDRDPNLARRCRMTADVIQSTLNASAQYAKIPLRRPLSAISDFFASLRGNRLLATAAIALALAAITYLMVFVPATYRVSCTGRLMPSEQNAYFAPMDARVVEVFVEDGQTVDAGQQLIKLTSETLSADLVTAEVAVAEHSKLIDALNAKMSELQVSRIDEQALEIQAEIAATEIKLAGQQETVKILRDRFDQLTVRADSPGTINAFRIKETLLNRPVARGDKLLEIVDIASNWQLELEIDEYRSGLLLKQFAETEHPMKVTYLLATEVNRQRVAALTRLASHVDYAANGQELVIHAIAETEMDDRSASSVGAEVYAKIEVGQQPWGYVLFGDLLDFLRRTIWL